MSRDHAVCLAAEHAERRRSPRLHELGDADAEGADPFPVQINNVFLGDRSTVAVLNIQSVSYSSQSSHLGLKPAACAHEDIDNRVHKLQQPPYNRSHHSHAERVQGGLGGP